MPVRRSHPCSPSLGHPQSHDRAPCRPTAESPPSALQVTRSVTTKRTHQRADCIRSRE
jgi:hypothetical protein